MKVNAKEFKSAVEYVTKYSHVKYDLIFRDGAVEGLNEDNVGQKLYLSYKIEGAEAGPVINGRELTKLRKLFKFWKTELEITQEDNKVIITDGIHSFSCESETKFNDWVPDIGETVEEGSFDASSFAEKGKKLVPFASTDCYRECLLGVYFDAEDGSLVATDGRRLGYISYPKKLPSMHLPSGIFAKIDGMGSCVFRLSQKGEDKFLTVTDGMRTVTAYLIGMNFPNWRRVVPPTDGSFEQTVDIVSLKEAAEYAVQSTDYTHRALMTDGKFCGVGYKAEPSLEAALYFNAIYIKEALDQLNGDFAKFYVQKSTSFEGLETFETTKPVTLTDGELNAIIMPMCAE